MLYYDVTDLMHWTHPHLTGIQRVVTGVLTGLSELQQPLHLIAYSADQQAFVATSFNELPSTVRRYIPSAQLDPPSSNIPFTSRSPIQPTVDTDVPVLLSLCASWCVTGHPEAVSALRAQGVHILRMIYDLVPTLKPHWVLPHDHQQVTAWVHTLLQESDQILTISEFSKQEIAQYGAIQGLPTPPITVVRLGDQLTATAAQPSHRHASPGKRPFFLCVSTLDVRKNHRLLYDAWSVLRRRHGDRCPDLICVGLPHLHVTNLLHEIQHDPEVKDHIHLLQDVEDTELAWYYQQCLATIYPSRYEGWGLPVAESLGYGKLCLASNTSSIPEIDPELPLFFDPLDLYPFVSLIEKVLDDPAWVRQQEKKIRRTFTPTPWRHTASQIQPLLNTSTPTNPSAPSIPAQPRHQVPFNELAPAEQARIAVTIACRDTDPIPKVAQAGHVMEHHGIRVQRMHEGSLVIADGYCGRWTTRIIEDLHGHHEPQEELLFHALLPCIQPGALMVELGANWAYYTNWFLGRIPDSRAACIEPDPKGLELGRRNLALNQRQATMIHAEMGGHARPALKDEQGQITRPERLHMPALFERLQHQPIELLHMDIQGAERPLLQSLPESGCRHLLRFVFVSTHHHIISGSPHTHQECIDLLRARGAVILEEHDIAASHIGDGLIVASFRHEDLQIPLPPISRAPKALSDLIWQWTPGAMQTS
jgi:FkbM family methyltransferase